MSILTARYQRSRPSAPSMPEPARDPALMHFLTIGGATVELHSYQFSTRYTAQGRPFVSDESREVNGFRWHCLGCDESGPHMYSSYDLGYLPNERDDARNHANVHASKCRAMPKPNGA